MRKKILKKLVRVHGVCAPTSRLPRLSERSEDPDSSGLEQSLPRVKRILLTAL